MPEIQKPIEIGMPLRATAAQDFTDIRTTKPLTIQDGNCGVAGVSAYVNRAIEKDCQFDEYKDTLAKKGAFEPGPVDKTTEIGTYAQQLLAARTRVDRRLSHALQYMRRKGLRPAGIKDILQTMARRNDQRLNCQMILLTSVIGGIKGGDAEIGIFTDQDDLISDEIFAGAIEMAMFNSELDLMYSKEPYGKALEDHAGEIFQYAILLYYMTKMLPNVDTLVHEHNQIASVVNKAGGSYMAAYNTMLTDIERIKKDHETNIRTARTDIAGQHESEKQALRQRADALEKQLRPKDAEIDRLKAELATARTEIKSLNADLDAARKAVETKDGMISDLADKVARKSTEAPMALPEDGILVLGGTKNALADLMAEHPGWRFVDGHDHRCKDIRKPRVIFVLPYGLDHGTTYRVRKAVGPDVPTVFVTSLNTDALRAEMSGKYAALFRDDNNDKETNENDA